MIPIPPGEQTRNIKAGEQEAKDFHKKTAPDAIAIWLDGLNLYLAGSHSLAWVIGFSDTHVLTALLTRAWNGLYCAYELALIGYYAQSLNVIRTALEDWVAYWYVRYRPEEHSRFVNSSLSTPKFNDMVQVLESIHGHKTSLRQWIKHLHGYSHVDIKGVLLVFKSEPGLLRVWPWAASR